MRRGACLELQRDRRQCEKSRVENTGPVTEISETSGWNLVKELEMEGRGTGLWQAEGCVMLKPGVLGGRQH